MNLLSKFIPLWIIKLFPVNIVRKQINKISPNTEQIKQATKTIFVDISTIHNCDSKTGIQRVVRAILLKLIDNPPNGFKISPVYATKKTNYKAISVHTNSDYFGGYKPDNDYCEMITDHGDIFLALDLCANIIPFHEREIIKWKTNGVKIYFLVYDILPLSNPEWFTKKSHNNFKCWTRTIARYSDGVICISETVRQNVEQYFKHKYYLSALEINTTVIPLGSDLSNSHPSTGEPTNVDLINRLLENKEYILVVGTVEPRKGHSEILKAFDILWTGNYEIPLLVIVGKAGWKTENLQKTIRQHKFINKKLMWIDDASDAFLAKLYKNCQGVLIGSFAEGYGLPLVEANYYGVSILARNLPVFKELSLTNITFYESSTPFALSEAISTWIKKDNSGCKRSKVTTWEISKSQLLKSMNIFD